MAQSIAYILTLERESLQQVYVVNKTEEKAPFKQNDFVRPLYIGITKEELNEMLSYTKFNNVDYFRETTKLYEAILLAEQTYQDCYELLNEYNQALDESLEFEAMGPLTIAVENLAQKAKKDSQLSFKNFEKNCKKAILLNEEAKVKLDELSVKIFGSKYRPIN